MEVKERLASSGGVRYVFEEVRRRKRGVIEGAMVLRFLDRCMNVVAGEGEEGGERKWWQFVEKLKTAQF